VTAAAGIGIGGSIVRRFLAEGASVVASDAHEGRVGKLVADTGVEAEVIDVRNAEQLAGHLEGALERHGRIDVLVNCAGTNAVYPVWELSDEDWQRVLDVNVTSILRACRVVLPAMISAGSGSVISIASVSALQPSISEAAYSVTKAAVVALTRAMAKDVAEHHIRVNAIAPNTVDNPFLANVYSPEKLAAERSGMPFGRCVNADEVAAAAAWLASDEASYVTGETLVVGGAPFLRSGTQ
jgi:3-oxoacyl-[acyl-carrier protein] reductase